MTWFLKRSGPYFRRKRNNWYHDLQVTEYSRNFRIFRFKILCSYSVLFFVSVFIFKMFFFYSSLYFILQLLIFQPLELLLLQWNFDSIPSHLTFTCSKSIIETPEKGVKYVHSKLTIKTPERGQWRRSGVFTVNFEYISHLFLEFTLLTLNN